MQRSGARTPLRTSGSRVLSARLPGYKRDRSEMAMTEEREPAAEGSEVAPAVFADVINDAGVSVLVFEGDVDLANTSDIEHGVASVLATANPAALVLDLNAVEFMDSTGLRMLWVVRQMAQDAKARLVIRAPSDAVLRLLRLTGMHRIFSIEAQD